ncbi:MAG: DeoR family transcriptional regulator [Gallintestinimicrobium sp.]
MLTEKRQEEIVRLVYERESITVAELKEILHSSESTIRRDIIALDQEGRLTKVFGGAIALRTAQIVNKELSMVQKKDLQIAEKQAIARYAASLIEWDDCVYLDAGTSTGWMIEYIREAQATYVTNALSHAKRLADKGFHVILIGGPKAQRMRSLARSSCESQKYHFSKGFFGTNGVEQNGGFTTPDARSDGQADCGEKYAARKPLFPGDVFQIRESVRRDLRRLRGRSDPDGSVRAGKPAEERQGCQCEPTGTINFCLRRHRAIEGRFYRMKVMFVNGSSHLRGTTMAAIEEMEKVFRAEGIETEVIQVGGKPIADCLQCNVCGKTGKCVFTDDVE